MSVLVFEKYEGLGNDFLVIEEPPRPLSTDEVRRLCDRHFGVGGDGVLVVGAGRTAGSVGSMTVLNADGSRPEMCGNGLRCVAAYLAEQRGLDASSFLIDTDSGALGCEIDDGLVSISMGKASMVGALTLEIEGRSISIERVSTGNPHAILFGPHQDGDFERLGPALTRHPVFPEGTNVELVWDEPDGGLRVKVWERGVGPTLACGTGACATAVAACAQGRRPFDTELTVRLPGGPLFIRVSPALEVRMRGPARRVFRGEVRL